MGLVGRKVGLWDSWRIWGSDWTDWTGLDLFNCLLLIGVSFGSRDRGFWIFLVLYFTCINNEEVDSV